VNVIEYEFTYSVFKLPKLAPVNGEVVETYPDHVVNATLLMSVGFVSPVGKVFHKPKNVSNMLLAWSAGVAT
jgi:hypothetical protein